MKVSDYLKRVADGDREADAMVARELGCETQEDDLPDHKGGTWHRVLWRRPGEKWDQWKEGWPPPYATAGAEHPDRWSYFGEIVDAICKQMGYGWVDALDYVVNMWVVADPVFPNAAAAVALLLAAKVIEED